MIMHFFHKKGKEKEKKNKGKGIRGKNEGKLKTRR
jgi:hypothetical protein